MLLKDISPSLKMRINRQHPAIKDFIKFQKELSFEQVLHAIETNLDYNALQINLQKNKGIMDEATWVLTLIRYKKLKGYIWVSNYESGFREFLETNLAKVRQLPIFKRYFHLKDISTITYSKILVCESFDFSPQSKYVYYSLLAIARAMNKKIIMVDDVPNCRQLLKVNQKLTPER